MKLSGKLTRILQKLAAETTAVLIAKGLFEFVVSLTFTTAGALLLWKLLLVEFHSLGNFKWILAVVLLSGSMWLYIILLRKFSRRRPYFPNLDVDFEVVKFEITYQYTDATHMIYRKRKRLRALRKGLSVYYDKYRWTGTGTVTMTSLKGQPVHQTVKQGLWQLYEIAFQKSLGKGEEIETEITWQLEDIGRTAVPFISTTIEEPTDFLQFNLVLPPEFGVTHVTVEESSQMGSRKPFESLLIEPDGAGVFRWVEPRPRLLYHYQMKWDLN